MRASGLMGPRIDRTCGAGRYSFDTSGIRAVYGYGPSFGLLAQGIDTPYPDDLKRVAERFFSSSDQRLTLALAAAGPEFSSLEFALDEWAFARDLGARISVHVGVGQPGAGSLVQALHQGLIGRGLPGLGPDTTYIHCCTLSDEEIALIAGTGGTFSLAIPVEMQMGHGTPPIQRILDLGVRPSLSVDVETNQATDMFGQMRALFAVQRQAANQAELFSLNEPSPELRESLLSVRDVLQIATVEGARANGLLHRIGTLTPGKEADVLLLDAERINVAPVNDPAGAVVLGMDSSNVDTILVGGEIRKWKGELVGVDLPQLLERAHRAQEALLGR